MKKSTKLRTLVPCRVALSCRSWSTRFDLCTSSSAAPATAAGGPAIGCTGAPSPRNCSSGNDHPIALLQAAQHRIHISHRLAQRHRHLVRHKALAPPACATYTNDCPPICVTASTGTVGFGRRTPRHPRIHHLQIAQPGSRRAPPPSPEFPATRYPPPATERKWSTSPAHYPSVSRMSTGRPIFTSACAFGRDVDISLKARISSIVVSTVEGAAFGET